MEVSMPLSGDVWNTAGRLSVSPIENRALDFWATTY
jgi:hypothetical protein